MRRAIEPAAILLFATSLLAPVLSGASRTDRQDVESVEASIRALEDRERQGVLTRDKAALEQIWSEEFTVNAPSNQVVAGRRGVFAQMDRGLLHYSNFERRIEAIRVDGDRVLVMGGETVTPAGAVAAAGQTVRRRFSHVWRREPSGWRLWARHANIIPAP